MAAGAIGGFVLVGDDNEETVCVDSDSGGAGSGTYADLSATIVNGNLECALAVESCSAVA